VVQAGVSAEPGAGQGGTGGFGLVRAGWVRVAGCLVKGGTGAGGWVLVPERWWHRCWSRAVQVQVAQVWEPGLVKGGTGGTVQWHGGAGQGSTQVAQVLVKVVKGRTGTNWYRHGALVKLAPGQRNLGKQVRSELALGKLMVSHLLDSHERWVHYNQDYQTALACFQERFPATS